MATPSDLKHKPIGNKPAAHPSGAGALLGAAVGVSFGALGGPVGSLIGGVVGAVAGCQWESRHLPRK
ncbi:glycine zipper domain-containing protein [Polaromonas sp.]|uniref:glycine zipper domain-containing protein n=1 Tax=Polaromonas sp. TaxID=1869339 RepID=UPI00286A8C88|nr:glycine zipper domain-containing protein [Polaromonas sp.]